MIQKVLIFQNFEARIAGDLFKCAFFCDTVEEWSFEIVASFDGVEVLGDHIFRHKKANGILIIDL